MEFSAEDSLVLEFSVSVFGLVYRCSDSFAVSKEAVEIAPILGRFGFFSGSMFINFCLLQVSVSEIKYNVFIWFLPIWGKGNKIWGFFAKKS